MATITVDGTSAVAYFLAAAMQQHDELQFAPSDGLDAVRRILNAFPAGAEQQAINECRSDPIGPTVLTKVAALTAAMQLVRNAAVQRADSDKPWSRTSPDWIKAGEAYGQAISELMPFCRPPIQSERVMENRQSDTETDTPKKKLKMNAAAAGAATLFRKLYAADDTITLLQAVSEYVDKHGGSSKYIYRILNDNPDQWKT